MTNCFMLVGRIAEIKDNGIVIKVARYIKDIDGTYKEDLIFAECFEYIITRVKDYCKINDLVGTKGRIQIDNDKIRLICEKFTFLSSDKDILEKEGTNEE